MTAAYRAHDVDEYYGAPGVVLPAPTGLASGDVILAALLTNDGSRVLTTLPSGWTTIAQATSTTAPGIGFWLCKKVAGGSEPADYTFTFNFSFNGRAFTAAYSDGSDVSAYSSAGLAAAGSTSPYEILSDAATAPDDDSKVLFIGAARFTTTGSAPTFTSPSGYAERIDSGADYDNRALTLADKTQASAGTTGSATGSVVNATGGAAQTVGVIVVIAPAAGSVAIAAGGSGELPVIASVVLSSSGEAFAAGNYSDVTLTLKNQGGIGIAGLSGTITSTDTNIATVSQLDDTDSSGQATVRIVGVAAGSCTVTATFDGVVSNQVAVTITTGARLVVGIVPESATLEIGDTQQFSASVEGETTGYFGWSIQSGSGTIDQTGLYTATTAGTTIIRATYSEDTNLYAEAAITVNAAPATGPVSAGIVASRPWKNAGVVMSGVTLDYWIISASDEVIASGSKVTDSTGKLTVTVSSQYVGQSVNMVVNNLSSSMETSGKFHGQQVITVI